MRKPLSLYIHIPFCNSKCAYCSFVSKVGNLSEKSRYTQNLIEEIRTRAKQFNPRYEIATIYIGGGTPSCMEKGTISRILNEIYTRFTVRNKAEITLEVNPESVTREKMAEYVRAGVNRISIGLQCTQPKILALMGRKHSFEDFEKAVAIAREMGITNISADIILGFPNQTKQNVCETVEKLIKMDIPHISAYMLSVESGTILEQQISQNLLTLPSEKTTIIMYQSVVQLLENAGYVRYELSNFSKIGYRSQHNQVYWNRGEYLGLGASAHSFVDGVRLANLDSINEYNARLEDVMLPVESASKVTKEDAKEEFVMLSLRMKEGMDLKKYEAEFGENFAAQKKQKIADLINLKLLKIVDDHLVATNAGFLVLNRIILELVS